MDLPKVVTKPVRQRLDPRQLDDYIHYKTDLLTWLIKVGKTPNRREGYAHSTVRNVTYKVDQFFRWKWDRDGRYTTEITPDDADEWMDSLIFSDEDYSDTHLDICQKALKRVFKFHNHRRGRYTARERSSEVED